MSFWRIFSSKDRHAGPEPSSEDARAAIARMYRGWARARGLEIEQVQGLRINGTVSGRDVVIDPGIDGRAPGWVQVTVVVALPAAVSVLVTRATPAGDELTAAVRSLFDDEDIGPELRAISVAPRHLRLRLAPGAPPDVVETAVGAVARALRMLYAPPSDPRQSCNTTAPYPA